MGGLLIGLISPGRTYIEPMVAVFLIAVPTAFILHLNQTVKTMPAFMYVLMSALGVLFTLIGSYLGERIQLGPTAQSSE
jgi:drug/metabolite transporter (DMT)-like permease